MNKIAHCKICNKEIDFDNYFSNNKESYYLCCEDCADKIKNDEIYHIQYCSAYEECKQLDNLRRKCISKEKYGGNSFNIYSPLPNFPSFCSPSEVSIIKSNVKILNFVEESEKRATELNNETLNLTKDNINLAKAMLAVSLVNLALIVMQIILQIFLK